MENNIPKMNRVQQIHFVGIGGAGMSGIAEVLCNQGYTVSGSDVKASPVTEQLQSLGMTIHIGHAAKHVETADLVVTSTAISADNPEVTQAKSLQIPVVPRAAMLAELMRLHYGIAVAGTHGKTTATSLLASLLADGGLDPTFVIGGRLNSLGSNARLGTSDYFLAEADESDASFLYLQPRIAVLTNIDRDHMSTYAGDFDKLRQTFLTFVHHLPFDGLAVVCSDDPIISNMLSEIERPTITYGFNEEADIRAVDFHQAGMHSAFTVLRRTRKPGQVEALPVTLNLPGKHNVLNALAAIAIANELGVSDDVMSSSLHDFHGIARRCQYIGERVIGGKTVLVVDDYGHHPCEMTSMLETVRASWSDRRLVLVFQPHRYTRTRDLYEDFVDILSNVDTLVLLEVYPASEAPIAGAEGRDLCRSIRNRGRVEPVFVERFSEVPAVLADIVQEGDLVLTLGAGDVGEVPGLLSR